MPAFTQSDVRQPRATLLVDGAPPLPCAKASVTRSSKRSSDKCHVTLAIGITERFGMDEAWWASIDHLPIQVLMSEYSGDPGESVFSGEADHIDIDWIERTVTLSGRDKSSKLTETRRSKKYNNQSVSDVVNDIAQANGLTAQVSGGDEMAGKTYDQDETHLILNGTDFETLSSLAERSGCRWYVDGDTLHFEPTESDTGIYELVYRPAAFGQQMAANFVKLKTSRNLRAAKKAKVTVKSWHHKDKKLYEHTEEVDGGGGNPLVYEHHLPGLNQAQVESRAKARMKDIIRHELSISVHMPGDLSVKPTQKLSLTGTGSIYDQIYDIDSVDFEMGYGAGFEMTIKTKAPKSSRGGSGGGSDYKAAWASGTQTIDAAKAPQ